MQSLYGVQASEAARVWSRAGRGGRHAVMYSTRWGGGRKEGCVQPWFLVEPCTN